MIFEIKLSLVFLNLKRGGGFQLSPTLFFNRPNIENPILKGFLGQELRGL